MPVEPAGPASSDQDEAQRSPWKLGTVLSGAGRVGQVVMGTEPQIVSKELRTPQAAAVAGVAFSLLLGASLLS